MSLLLALMLSAAPSMEPAPPADLRWDPRIDLPIVGVAALGWLGTEFVFKGALAPTSCRWCETNGFDTAVRRVFNPSLTPSAYGLAGPDLASNITVLATPVTMLALDALLEYRDGALSNVPADFTIIAEATLLAACMNQAVKFAVGRARPYTIGASAELLAEKASHHDHDLSFFSNHTTFTFAAVSATATVAALRGYRLGFLTWAIGVPLALTTGLLRLAADKHWASDVLVGMVIGAATGIALPVLFHGRSKLPASVQVSAGPSGVSVFGTF